MPIRRGKRVKHSDNRSHRRIRLRSPTSTLRGLDFPSRGDTSIETSTRDISIETEQIIREELVKRAACLKIIKSPGAVNYRADDV